MVTLRRVATLLVLLLMPAIAAATTFTDTSAGATFNVASSPLGGVPGCNLVVGSHVYAARTLTTNNTTTYTFSVTGVSGFSGDPFMAVYAGTFNPASPTANLVACNDDANGTLLPQFTANLSANTTYTIVTTSFATGVGGSATYDVTPDVTLAGAPVLSAVSVTGITTTAATLQGTSSSAGTGYYVVQAQGLPPPSTAQVIAGQQSNGAAAFVSGNGVMAAATARNFALSPLNPGTWYHVYLVVRDNQTPQLSSVPMGAMFATDTTAPGAPVIGTATAGDRQATVSFTAPASDGGDAIVVYEVRSSPTGFIGRGTASPITVSELINGTSYTFTVTAVNNVGVSAPSAPSNAVIPVGPPALTDFGPFTRTFGDAPSAIAAPTSPSAGAFTYTSSNPAVATISGDVVTVVSAGTTTITANQAANGAYTAGSTTATLTVARAVPVLGAFPDITRVFGAPSFTLTAPTSTGPGAITYSSSDPAVATVSGNTVTALGVGTATLTASQAATANYEAVATTAQIEVTPQTPTLGAFGDISATFGDAPITLSAPTSPSAGAFTYTSSDTSVATVSGDVVTMVGAGTATITASQAANGNYGPAQTTAQLQVGVATPVLSNFGAINATFGDPPITLVAPSSPSAGAFTYISSDTSVATISGNVLTVVGAGTATLTASQAANGNYGPAQTTAQLQVGVATPVLAGFGDINATFGDAPTTLTAPTSPSAGAFTYTSSDTSVAMISGNVVTIVGAGTATITASQAANGNYGAAQTAAQLQVATAVPTLTSFSPLTATFGDAPITLVAPNSPSAGSFSYASSDTSVATISGNVVTIVGSGTATITATQAASGNYASGSVTAPLNVGVAVPVLSGFANINATFGDAPVTLVAPNSPSAGAFTYTSSDTSVATISGNVLTIVGAGSATITATQAASGNYGTAQTTAQLQVAVATPALSNFNDISATFGDAPITLTAPTSPSAGAFTYTSSNPAVATISGNVVTIVGAGTATLTATQAASGNYGPAQTTAQLQVGVATPVLSNFDGISATFGDAPITLTVPTSPSAGAFTYTSSNPAVATISGNVVTITGSGSATITATQAANGNYGPAQTTAQLQVGVATPVLSNFDDISATFGDAPITLTVPTSPSAGAFTYTSSNPAVATISGNVVTITGSGSATITASQAANGNYGPAQTTAQLQVGVATPVLSNFDDITATFGDAPITLTAPTSPSSGAFTYTSSDTGVATVSGNVVTIVGTGTATLTATQAAQGHYAAAQITAQLQVGAATPVITGFGDINKVQGQPAFDLVDPTSNSPGAFTYSIDNAAVATISGRTVTIVGAGTATITATQAATANYTAGSVTAQLVVDARPDPTTDAEVVGSLQAQMDTALRFASAQQSNVRDRLRQRRTTGSAATGNGLSLSAAAGEGGITLQPELIDDERQASGSGWSIWTGGAINTGHRNVRGGGSDHDFRSDGITVGADTLVRPNVLVGVAVGGGWSDTDVGASGSKVDAEQRVLTVYGLWRGSDSLFVDGQLAVGRLDYDLRRWSSTADAMGLAQREGSQLFGSVTFGYESVAEARRLTGYGRIDAGRTTLDPYRESGLGIYDLAYREQTVEQRSVAVGIEGSYDVVVDWAAAVRPYWQLEYRNDFSRRSDAAINYVIAPADADYRLSLDPWSSSNWNLGFGADFAFGRGVIVTALVRHELNVGMGSNTTVGLQLSLDFGGNYIQGGNPAPAADATKAAPTGK